MGEELISLPTNSNEEQALLPTHSNEEQDLLPTHSNEEQDLLPTHSNEEHDLLPTHSNEEQDFLPTHSNEEQDLLPSHSNEEQDLLPTHSNEEQDLLPTHSNEEQDLLPTHSNEEQDLFSTHSNEEHDLLSTHSNEEQDLLQTHTDEEQYMLMWPSLENLNELIQNRTQRSTLEILLVLHYCLFNISDECQCSAIELFMPTYNVHFLSKYFTGIKYMTEFISTKVSENLVKDFNLDWKSDYQVHLLHLLHVSLSRIVREIDDRSLSQDEFDLGMEDKLLTSVRQIIVEVDILISRHGWHYRKEMKLFSETSRAGQRVQLPIRHLFFNFYENCADTGRFPYIFWQETPLREKIRDCGSLEEIFSNGNEELCCVCMTDKERFKENFGIFLNCNHPVCASCAACLLIDDNQNRYEFVLQLTIK